MTVQLTRAFLDFLWLTGTSNLGQTCNSDLRTKIEVWSASIPWWQCVTVAWNWTTRGASRNEPLKTRKIHSLCPRRARCTDCYTDVYSIIACFPVIHTRACVIIHHFRVSIGLGVDWRWVKLIENCKSWNFLRKIPGSVYKCHIGSVQVCLLFLICWKPRRILGTMLAL